MEFPRFVAVVVGSVVALAACVGDDPAPGGGPGAVLALTPEAHDFGKVRLGERARRTFTVRNTSAVASAPIGAATVTGPGFAVANDGCKGLALGAEAACSVEVEHAPTAVGEVVGAFEISAGAVVARATLRGAGVAAPTLTVKRTGDGGGRVKGAGIDCGDDCSESFEQTADAPKVELTALPDAGSFFAGWSGGGCSGLAPKCTVVMSTSVEVAAAFTKKVPIELTVALGPDATTKVASVPAGLECSAACDKKVGLFDLGASVTFDVTSTDVYRWNGAACSGKTCSVVADGPKSVSLRASAYNLAFVTSTKQDGNLGGLAGADAKCQGLADAAGLPGTFRALLSTSAVDARDRFTAGGGWVRVDGKIWSATKSEVFTTFRSRSPLWLDEGGVRRSTTAWTGSSADGVRFPGRTCADWTATASPDANVGVSAYSFGAVNANVAPCASPTALYCLGDDLARPVPAPAIGTSRRAFVSTGKVSASAGVAGFDALCASEATAAGFAAPATYKAFVAPSTTVAAASRFSAAGARWVRVDGVDLATTAAKVLAGDTDAALDLDAMGLKVDDSNVFTGYRVTAGVDPSPMKPGTHTCADWTAADAASQAGFGLSGAAGSIGYAAYPANAVEGCAAPRRVYCLQD